MAQDYDYSFSASKLNPMKECARCFYDANKLKVERPRGIFPGLPGGVDRVMKEIRDGNRQLLPSYLQGTLNGRFSGTVDYITRLRNWQSGLKAMLTISGKQVRVLGALDDLFEEVDGSFSPFDDKTKGDVPKDDGAQYYQLQVDLYALLIEQNGMIASRKAYLNYHYPISMDGDEIVFGHVLYTLTAYPERAIVTMEQAIALLEGGQPDSNQACEYCRFAQARVTAAVKVLAQPAVR